MIDQFYKEASIDKQLFVKQCWLTQAKQLIKQFRGNLYEMASSVIKINEEGNIDFKNIDKLLYNQISTQNYHANAHKTVKIKNKDIVITNAIPSENFADHNMISRVSGDANDFRGFNTVHQ